MEARRVILLVKAVDSDSDVVKAFLRHSSRSEKEYEHNDHYIHLDPDRQGEIQWSHIVLDMNASTAAAVNLWRVPHEIYKARSKDDRL